MIGIHVLDSHSLTALNIAEGSYDCVYVSWQQVKSWSPDPLGKSLNAIQPHCWFFSFIFAMNLLRDPKHCKITMGAKTKKIFP